ncbi:MAG: M20/M25/M40 family metallo-hydrolase [Rhizomicrobium sp.]
MDSKASGARPRLILLAALAVAIWVLGATFNGLPAPRPMNAPATAFSAARANVVLRDLLGPEIPHPVSSRANDAVRERIRKEFAALHVGTSVYRALGCNGRRQYGFFACGTVEDIIAEVAPGQGKAIVLLAHYDSVPAGPGAADDQSGVATVLETVRALQARGLKTRHPILALITDGEEAGLLGAAAFADNPAFLARVGVVVNVEARGNQGPSLLFQTSPGDGALIDLYAQSVPEYATSSLFAVIYRLLPNDTDLTVFLDRGQTGYNFAFSGNVAHYHTPLDRRENLSLATLQHHGDNLLGTVSGLMQTDFAALKGGDAIYLTVFGHLLPRLPASWAIPLAVLVILLLVAAAWASRGEVLGIGRRLVAFSIPPAALLGAALFGWLLHTVASLVSGQPDPSYAHPVWLRLALALGVATALLLWTRLASPRLAALSVWSWFAGLGLVTAIFLPGLSPYFLFPALIAAILLIVQARLDGAGAEAVGVLLALPALVIWLSLSSASELVQGLALHPLITVTMAFAALPLLPLLAPRPPQRCAAVTAVAGLVLAVIAGLHPAYSVRQPERLNLSFVDDHIAGKAVWAADPAGALPASLRAAMPFSAARRQAMPLSFTNAYAAPAGATRYAAPSAAIASRPDGAGRRVTLALHGSALANRMVVVVPKDAGLLRAEIDGKSFAPDPGAPGPYGTVIACMTDDCRGKSVTLVFASRKPVGVTLGEQHYGLPADAARLVAARPATAVPSQSGDTTIVFGRLTL